MNEVGAVQLAKALGAKRTVVSVAVDFGLKYLTGTYIPPDRASEGFAPANSASGQRDWSLSIF
jgi:hypothetical protein